MLKTIDILNKTQKTGNPIILIDTAKGLPVGGNREANDLFAEAENLFEFFKIFSKEVSIEIFMILENFTGKHKIEDCEATTLNRDVFHCTLDFTYASDTKESIFIIMKVKEDNRSHYINILLNHKKRPAFILEFVDSPDSDLVIHEANDLFYQSFACCKETIGEKYKNSLQRMINKEGQERYVMDIKEAIKEQEKGIVEIPFQTVHGETLAFYFSHSTIKPLLDKEDNRIFCQLVKSGEMLESIENPFTHSF